MWYKVAEMAHFIIGMCLCTESTEKIEKCHLDRSTLPVLHHDTFMSL